MNSKTFNQLIKLNNDFYSQIAKEFDETRQSPWRGWKEIMEIEEVKKIMSNSPRILDIASGNGRFYGFLKNKYKYKFEYIGLENNDYLLNTSREKYGKQLFKKFDVIKDLDEINETYDLIVAFGITHHIPSREFREKWMNLILKKLKPGGCLAISFWDFGKHKVIIDHNKVSYLKKSGIEINQLEKEDYFIGWNNMDLLRYCNGSFKNEFDKLIKKNNTEFTFVFTFEDYGSERTGNSYKILKKALIARNSFDV